MVGTGLTFFTIDKMALFVVTCAVWSKEILDAGATTGNRLAQHRLHRFIKFTDRCLTQPIHFTVWMELGAKEDFVRVNIPNPRDHLLMHQQRLQPAAPGLHETDEFIARHRERIDPKAASAVTIEAGLIEQGQSSETARVPVAQSRFTPSCE